MRPFLVALEELWALVRARDFGLYAQSLAYSFLFALVPLLLILSTALGRLQQLGRPALFQGPVRTLVAPQLQQLLSSAVSGLSSFHRHTLISLGIVGFLWAMTNAMRQLMRALNHDSAPPPSPWAMTLVRPAAVGLTVGTLMVLAESFMVAGQELTRWAIGHLTHSAVSPWIVTVVRWIIFLVLLWAILTFIYNGLARPRPHFRWLTPGSAVVTVTWVLLSLGFSFYTAHWATYNTLYGSLGAVILLMIYLNLLSYALLVGGAINAFTLARDAPKDESTP